MAENSTEGLLRCAVQILGRMAVPPEKVRDLVATRGKKQVKAFNYFDGTKTMAEVGKKLKIDSGNLSRTVGRWVASGIMFRIGSGDDARLLHIYPIPESESHVQRDRR